MILPRLSLYAGLSEKVRTENQERFSRDDIRIIVATIAFGMGINKPNIWFVVHYDLPGSIDNSYQEIGRAGRDGLPAHCLLRFGYGDIQKVQFFIGQKTEQEQRVANILLSQLLGFAETDICRRVPLLNYCGETYLPDRCEMCDNCRMGEEKKNLLDRTIPAQMFLSCVKRTGELFGAGHIADVLRGKETFLGRLEEAKKDHGAVLRQQDGEAEAFDAGLFETLRKKRKELADQANLPPYAIFHDRTLREMALYYPRTRKSLLAFYGIGKSKLEKHADTFLEIIKEHCRTNQIPERQEPALIVEPAPTPPADSGKRRYFVIGELFNQGRTIEQLAGDFNIQRDTVLNHLYRCVCENHPLRKNDFLTNSGLTEDQQQAVFSSFARLGTERLRPVFEDLNGTIPYEELQLLRLHHLCQNQL